MQVKDCMHTHVTTVTPETLVSTADQMMHDKRIRHLPVVTEQHTLVGVLTDRDVRRAEASDAPSMTAHELTYLLDKQHVQDIMTRDVVTVRSTTPLEEAGQIFLQKKFGCLPVVGDNHRLEGIITVADLLRVYIQQYTAEERIGIESMMQTQVITATPAMSLAEVQRLMRDHHIRHVPVVSGKRLVGMLTDRDIREASPSPATTLTRGEIAYQMETTPIKTCMTKDVVWLCPGITMANAARELLQRTIGCLPVVDHGTLVGIVTDMDCLRAFLHTAHRTESREMQPWTSTPKGH
jgi:CBS domain-containing protein